MNTKIILVWIIATYCHNSLQQTNLAGGYRRKVKLSSKVKYKGSHITNFLDLQRQSWRNWHLRSLLFLQKWNSRQGCLRSSQHSTPRRQQRLCQFLWEVLRWRKCSLHSETTRNRFNQIWNKTLRASKPGWCRFWRWFTNCWCWTRRGNGIWWIFLDGHIVYGNWDSRRTILSLPVWGITH